MQSRYFVLLVLSVFMTACASTGRPTNLADSLSLTANLTADVLIVRDEQSCSLSLMPLQQGESALYPAAWYLRSGVERRLTNQVSGLIGMNVKNIDEQSVLPRDKYLIMPNDCVNGMFEEQLKYKVQDGFGDFEIREWHYTSKKDLKKALKNYKRSKSVDYVLVLRPSAGFSFDLKYVRVNLNVEVVSNHSGDRYSRNYIFQSARNSAIEDARTQVFESEQERLNTLYEEKIARNRGSGRQYFNQKKQEKLEHAKRVLYYNTDILPSEAWQADNLKRVLVNGMRVSTDLARYDLSIGMNDKANPAVKRDSVCFDRALIKEEGKIFTLILNRENSQVLRSEKGDLLFAGKKDPLYLMDSEGFEC